MAAENDSVNATQNMLAEFREVVAEDLMGLAVLHNRELDTELLENLKKVGFPRGLGLNLSSTPGQEALRIMEAGLKAIADPGSQQELDDLAADYANIYLTHGLRSSPLESVWLDEDGLAMQEPMFQIRGIYGRYGYSVQDWRKRSDDHLVHQLQFLAYLFEPDTGEGERLREISMFMDEHILRWIDQFAGRVATRCQTLFYAGLATLTAAYLEEVRDLLAEILQEPRPSAEEIAERMKPKPMVEAELSCGDVGSSPSW